MGLRFSLLVYDFRGGKHSAMKRLTESRRDFLKAAGTTVGAALVSPYGAICESNARVQRSESQSGQRESDLPEHTLHIGTSPIEIAPN